MTLETDKIELSEKDFEDYYEKKIYRYVIDEIWKQISSIVRKRTATVIYHGNIDNHTISKVKTRLYYSGWSEIKINVLGDDSKTVVLFEFKQ